MAASRSIVQELHQIQKRCGYLPRAELETLSRRRKNTPLHRLHEVASFFPHFRMDPPPTLQVKVCRDMACHLRGADDFRTNLEALVEEVGGGEVAVSATGWIWGSTKVILPRNRFCSSGRWAPRIPWSLGWSSTICPSLTREKKSSGT